MIEVNNESTDTDIYDTEEDPFLFDILFIMKKDTTDLFDLCFHTPVSRDLH